MIAHLPSVHLPAAEASNQKLGSTATKSTQFTDRFEGFGFTLSNMLKPSNNESSEENKEEEQAQIQLFMDLMNTDSIQELKELLNNGQVGMVLSQESNQEIMPETILSKNTASLTTEEVESASTQKLPSVEFPSMSMTLPELLKNLNLSVETIQQLAGKEFSAEIPDVKLSQPEALLWVASLGDKVNSLENKQLLTGIMQQAVTVLKGIALLAKASDGPAAQSVFVSNITKVLSRIEEKLGSMQKERTVMPTSIKANNSLLEIKGLNEMNGFSNWSNTRENKQVLLPSEKAFEQPTMINLATLQWQSSQSKWSTAAAPLKQNEQTTTLMEQFQSVMKNAKFGKFNGTEKLMIKLQPEHLGTLRIELVHKSGMLTARVMTTTGAAKELMDSQLHQLRQSLTGQNIQVEKIEVLHIQPEASKSDRPMDQPSQQSEQQKKHPDQQNQEEQSEEQSFHQIFMNIEV
ncbi:flagellar hook-length control protein FliK [Jeotgalibacillus soli]|uniref:Flagellar hook-length control protein-like C-terminal domain-containing protein n=1 Tax=Jeotgalibacillus soli TaxID=889306 RepID=A0A0C2RT14_9BACL|nr:flagellar hook-length control protein FliK [Jeotgalibacillus soli]KIL44889.1 hypothetical protein KP78_24330 [Jeotgalibacillus soli]